MFGKLIAGAATLLVLIGVPVAAETYAGQQLDQSVRNATQSLAPGAAITRVELHGRPFLAALLQGEVSSAYVDLRGATGATGTTTLILQGLHRDTGRVNTVLWFSHLPQPVALLPVKTAAGAYSPIGTATLDGKRVEVTYQATVEHGKLSLEPATMKVGGREVGVGAVPAAWWAKLTPTAVELPAVNALAVRAVSVGEDDITVELQQQDVATAAAHRAGA